MSQKNKQAKNTEILIIISPINTSPQQEKKRKMPSNVVLLPDFGTINTSESLRPSTDIFVYGM